MVKDLNNFEKKFETHFYVAEQENTGMRLDIFVSMVAAVTRSNAQKIIKNNQVDLNGVGPLTYGLFSAHTFCCTTWCAVGWGTLDVEKGLCSYQ